MKKKSWMLFVTAICAMSSFAFANECVSCEQVSTTQEEKKDETPVEVAVVEAPAVVEAEAVSN